MDGMDGLTDEQRSQVENYLRDLDRNAAALRAAVESNAPMSSLLHWSRETKQVAMWTFKFIKEIK